jgi:hypothetical protein
MTTVQAPIGDAGQSGGIGTRQIRGRQSITPACLSMNRFQSHANLAEEIRIEVTPDDSQAGGMAEAMAA